MRGYTSGDKPSICAGNLFKPQEVLLPPQKWPLERTDLRIKVSSAIGGQQNKCQARKKSTNSNFLVRISSGAVGSSA